MLEPRRFDAHKNAAVPMIVMLDHSEIDTEVSDTDVETVTISRPLEWVRKRNLV